MTTMKTMNNVRLKTRRFLIAASIGAVIISASCARLPERPEDLPELYPTVIVATFGGQPVENVTVNMTPLDPALKKWKSGGQTDAEGKVVVKTGFYYEGAPQGEFKLSFQKLQERVGDTLEDMQPLSLIPLKYGPTRTDLTITIAPEKKKTEYRFELDGGEEIVPVPKGATLGPRKRNR